MFEYNAVEPVIVPHTFTGLDYKMHGLYMDDQGNEAVTPDSDYAKLLAKAQEKVKKEQRNLSRKKKGSANYAKQRVKLAKAYEYLANLRKDFQHKLAKEIADNNDVVGVEDISVKAMAKRKTAKGTKKKGFRFGKSVSTNAWANFIAILEYKLKLRGKALIKVDRYFPSSQLCHVCGCRNKGTKALSVRSWMCPQCGTYHDRDHNAAINIRNEAQRIYFAKKAS